MFNIYFSNSETLFSFRCDSPIKPCVDFAPSKKETPRYHLTSESDGRVLVVTFVWNETLSPLREPALAFKPFNTTEDSKRKKHRILPSLVSCQLPDNFQDTPKDTRSLPNKTSLSPSCLFMREQTTLSQCHNKNYSLWSGFAKYIPFDITRRQSRSTGSVPAPRSDAFVFLYPTFAFTPLVRLACPLRSIRQMPSPAVRCGFAVGASIFLRYLERGALTAGGYPQTPAVWVPLPVAQLPTLLKRNAPVLRNKPPSLRWRLWGLPA